MNCPKCQAKLLPVDGEMFCLQCGTVVHQIAGTDNKGPVIEETADPLLQKAISDVVRRPVHFRLPVAQAPAPTPKAFNSMRAILAPPRPALVAAGAGGPTVAIPAAAVSAHDEKPASVAPHPVAQPIAQPPVSKSVAAALPAMPAAAPVPAAPPAPGSVAMPTVTVPPAINLIKQPDVPKPAATIDDSGTLYRAWLIGAIIFGTFVLGNIAIYRYFQGRVFPGVRVAGIMVGGDTAPQMDAALAAKLTKPSLTVGVGPSSVSLDVRNIGADEVGSLETEALAVGRDRPLPLAGLIAALFTKPIDVTLPPASGNEMATQLAAQVDHPAISAVPMVVSGQVVLIADKPGVSIGQSAAASSLANAFASGSPVSIKPNSVMAQITASAYSGAVAEAQAVLSSNIAIKLSLASYSPTAVQKGSWIVFNGPGRDIAIDPAGVEAYIASLPGSFDRTATYNAVYAALQARQGLTYTASTKRVTPVSKPASLLPALPLVSYTYCLSAPSSGDLGALTMQAGATLADTSGWALGGRVKFAAATSNCDFTLGLVSRASMGNLNPGCAGQTSCDSGDGLAINLDSWNKAPASWTTGLISYRAGLINNEVGHWLGFQHDSCLKSQPSPILTAPTLILDGCSPNWYAIPPELQGTKILSGF